MAAIVILAVLPAMGGAACRSSVDQEISTHAGSNTPPMDAFVEALRAADSERFLAFFSPTAPWRYVSTITEPPEVTEVAFGDLRADFERRQGWYEVLFDADGDDCFRDWTEGPEGASWNLRGASRFVRLRHGAVDAVYVEWRREGDRWVVSAMAEPSA